MNNATILLPLKPKKQTLSAKRFLIVLNRDKGKIKSARFVRPRLGSRSMGKFVVSYE